MKTQRKPRPKQTGTLIGVRVQPEQLRPLDAWIDAQPEPKPSRPDAIRHALADWLAGQTHTHDRINSDGLK